MVLKLMIFHFTNLGKLWSFLSEFTFWLEFYFGCCCAIWYIFMLYSTIQVLRIFNVWGLLSRIPPFHYFPSISVLSKHLWNIAFIFDKCHCRLDAVTPVKNQCDLKDLTGNFVASKVHLTKKFMNGALVTPTRGDVDQYLGCCIVHCSNCQLYAIKDTWHYLTPLPLDNMAAISQTTFLNAFSSMKTFVFWLEFHWSLFLRVLLTMSQHWFR